jgi:hypothetical protein
MKLSRNRIDDAPELDVHSSRFVTVTASRVCASAWANVHHTLVSVWRDRDGFESSAMGHTVFVDKRLEELRERIHVLSGHWISGGMNAARGDTLGSVGDDTIVQ